MRVISDDDIRALVSQRAFEAGIQYQMDGRVQTLGIAADGTRIDASVRGSGRAAYRQSIRLLRGPQGQLLFSSVCPCPVGRDCKHVAAVLLEYQE